MLIPTEQAEDLKHGLILLTEGIRHPDWITIVVDNATGFQSLMKTNDKDLTELQIRLVLTDKFNKNANAVIDRGCQELEEELRKLSPEGCTISQVTVSRAISAINRKLRQGGNISAYEIHTARDLNSGSNLTLNDDSLRKNQLTKRETQNKLTAPKAHKTEEIKIGDVVSPISKQDKHRARDIFLVTGTDHEKVQAQKILHPLTDKKKLMSKTYNTDAKRLLVVHDSNNIPPDEPKVIQPVENISYSPISSKFWDGDDDDGNSDDEENNPPDAIEEPQVIDAIEELQVIDILNEDEDLADYGVEENYSADEDEEDDAEEDQRFFEDDEDPQDTLQDDTNIPTEVEHTYDDIVTETDEANPVSDEVH